MTRDLQQFCLLEYCFTLETAISNQVFLPAMIAKQKKGTANYHPR